MRNINQVRQTLLLLLVLIFLDSCSEVNTSDPKKAFEFWAGTNPQPDIELINAKYWKSSHWSSEYILYLKFKPSKIWWEEFIQENNISIDKDKWAIPSNAPKWFNPTKISVSYRLGSSFSQSSRYFRDTITGVCYIYEIQL